MITYVLFVELNEARVFRVSREGVEHQVLRRHEIKHHTSRDPVNHKNGSKFFHELAEAVTDADEILLMGPSLAKDHFKAHLEGHHHDSLARKVVGSVTLDLMSDAQLLAESREFFRKYDLFGQNMPA